MPIAPNPVFPALTGVSLPVIRTPIWKTGMQEPISGADTRLQHWSYPRYRYTLTFDLLRQAAAFGELQTLMGFYNQVGGAAGVFQYQDPQDNAAPPDQFVAFGDGTSSQFQLVRARGGFVDPVFAVDTVINVKLNGVVQNPATYTVDTKGVVNFNASVPLGIPIWWNGSFNWFCRFDDDNYDFEQFTAAADFQGPLWQLKKLTFSTVKFGA